ncbi:arsenic metallochaperone ArsD family protein [Sorangium sp. So ce448]
MSVTIRVFDPAMCCSTGVCGPSIDPELTRFAGDVAAACELSGTIKAIAPGGAT